MKHTRRANRTTLMLQHALGGTTVILHLLKSSLSKRASWTHLLRFSNTTLRYFFFLKSQINAVYKKIRCDIMHTLIDTVTKHKQHYL